MQVKQSGGQSASGKINHTPTEANKHKGITAEWWACVAGSMMVVVKLVSISHSINPYFNSILLLNNVVITLLQAETRKERKISKSLF